MVTVGLHSRVGIAKISLRLFTLNARRTYLPLYLGVSVLSAIEELRRLLRDKNGWKNYFKSINELLGHVTGFNNLLKDLKAKVSGATLEDILASQDDFLVKAILGGFNIDKKSYEPRSLGLFYKYYLGIGIKSKEDFERFASRIKEGDTPINAGRDIPIDISENTIIPVLLNLLEGQLKYIIDIVGLEPKEEIYEPKDPLITLKALTNILNKSKALLPLYNKYSFIIQSFNSTPLFFLEQAYNLNFELQGENIINVKNHNVKDLFNNYRIEFEIIIVPNIENREERLRKAIIGHAEESAGRKIINIIGIIYILIKIIHYIQSNYNTLLFFKGVEDEFLEYLKNYKYIVENEIRTLQSKNILGESHHETFIYQKIIEKIINIYNTELIGKSIKEYYRNPLSYPGLYGKIFDIRGGEIGIRHYYVSSRGNINFIENYIQFTEFLRYFAPLGFLGLGAIIKSYYGDKEIIIHYLFN